jgi:nucleotide-binding universal stress UspA family protein
MYSAVSVAMTTTTSIQHILVPHDFSETAENALSFALSLAEKLGSRVTILHVYETPAYAFPEGPALTLEMTVQIEKAAATALAAVAARARRPGVEATTQLRQGSPWREIDAAARQAHADLIVMGTHGRRGLARALLGSVAEKVVRTASCPVLTVHAPEASH